MKKLILMLVTVVLAGYVSAGTITYSSTPNPFGPVGFNIVNQVLSFPQWNPADYPAGTTLDAITIELSGRLTGDQFFSLITGSNIDVTVTSQATMTLSIPGPVTLVTTIPLQTDTWPNQTAPASGSELIDVTEVNSAPISSLYFNLFSGASTIDLALNAVSSTVGGGGGSISTGANLEGRAWGTITYEWSIIPEPASFALLGLAGLVAIRRRR